MLLRPNPQLSGLAHEDPGARPTLSIHVGLCRDIVCPEEHVMPGQLMLEVVESQMGSSQLQPVDVVEQILGCPTPLSDLVVEMCAPAKKAGVRGIRRWGSKKRDPLSRAVDIHQSKDWSTFGGTLTQALELQMPAFWLGNKSH